MRTIHRRVRGAVHNAINQHNAGFRPALIGGNFYPERGPRAVQAIADFTEAARERGFGVELRGNGLYLVEAQS